MKQPPGSPQAYVYELVVTRAIGIYLVVLGHVLDHYGHNYLDLGHWEILLDFIYSFHMPLFFVVSGIVYGYSASRPVTLRQYLSFTGRKVKRLLFPYLILSLIILAIRYGMEFVVGNTARSLDLGGQLLNILVNPRLGSSPYLWFLYTLFLIFLIFPLATLFGRRIPAGGEERGIHYSI